VGTHVGFGAEILHAVICACAGYARLYAWLGTRSVATSRETTTLGSQHVGTIARVSAECVAPGRLQSGNTENGISGALGFLAKCPKTQPRSTG
jgi:hypothetical protein